MLFEGVTIAQNFVTEEEESNLVREIDKSPWVNSQSGRRKQANTIIFLNKRFTKNVLIHSWFHSTKILLYSV